MLGVAHVFIQAVVFGWEVVDEPLAQVGCGGRDQRDHLFQEEMQSILGLIPQGRFYLVHWGLACGG